VERSADRITLRSTRYTPRTRAFAPPRPPPTRVSSASLNLDLDSTARGTARADCVGAACCAAGHLSAQPSSGKQRPVPGSRARPRSSRSSRPSIGSSPGGCRFSPTSGGRRPISARSRCGIVVWSKGVGLPPPTQPRPPPAARKLGAYIGAGGWWHPRLGARANKSLRPDPPPPSQADYLRQLNRSGQHAAVIQQFESGAMQVGRRWRAGCTAARWTRGDPRWRWSRGNLSPALVPPAGLGGLARRVRQGAGEARPVGQQQAAVCHPGV
jgi:hypothetical protein